MSTLKLMAPPIGRNSDGTLRFDKAWINAATHDAGSAPFLARQLQRIAEAEHAQRAATVTPIAKRKAGT